MGNLLHYSIKRVLEHNNEVLVSVRHCVYWSTPLNEERVLNPDRETLFPDVNGLQHPSMPQLG